MPSPFPGMNPYIEQDAFWQDFHLEFLPAIRGRLVAQVRPKYIVMLDEHIYVQELASRAAPARGPRRRLAGGGARAEGPTRPPGSGSSRPPCRSRSPCRTSAASPSWKSGIVWAAS